MFLRPPRLWVFNQHYPPDALASGHILEAICSGLAQRGWQVTVFAGKPFLLPDHVEWRPQSNEVRKGVRVVRLPSWNRRTGTLGRLLHYGVYTLGALLQWTRRDPPDVCLCLTTPPVFAAFAGWTGWLLRDVPYVYNTQDLFPDILETSKYAGSWLERLGRWAAAIVEKKAARIVPIGIQMQNRLLLRGFSPQQVVLIPNPVDVEAITPIAAESNAWLQSLALPPGVFRVVYAGNFGHAQGLDTVIEAAQLLKHRSDIRFLLVGAGDGKQTIAKLAYDLPQVSIHDFAPAAQVLSAGHVGLVPLKPGMGSYLVPSKAINYLAAGTPIIGAAEPGSDMAHLIEKAACGFSYPAGDAAALANAIEQATALPDRLVIMGQAGRAFVQKHFAGPVVAAQFAALLQQVITQAKA